MSKILLADPPAVARFSIFGMNWPRAITEVMITIITCNRVTCAFVIVVHIYKGNAIVHAIYYCRSVDFLLHFYQHFKIIYIYMYMKCQINI